MICIAIPCQGSHVSAHFGHAPQFAFFQVNEGDGSIVNEEVKDAPPHEPGVLPRWLVENGANVVLAAGVGGRAVELLNEAGVDVKVGIQASDPREAVEGFLKGALISGGQVCDHHGGQCHE